MIRPSWPRPARRAASGARALGQGLLGMALIALAAFALLPSADAATATDAGAVTMESQTFPAQASVAGAPLRLNGVGLRAAFIYKVYLAGLYLPAKAATGTDALAQPGPKRVQVRMLMDGPSDEFAKAFTGGIAKRTPAGQVAAMQDRIAAFDRTLRSVGKVHKGDVVDLDWLPTQGLALRINGKPVGAPVPGADLYGAMLAIFVGDRPVDAKMKAGMLGAAG
ncbi:MAG: chalcone isomerase family protein [Burkholderiales bacterium]|nr:chalcone isomerase family protein [Burkholderiales bacterium]